MLEDMFTPTDGNVLQVRVEQEHHLVFGNQSHRVLLANFLRYRGVEFTDVPGRGPDPTGDQYELTGDGCCRVSEKKIANFYGKSERYGKGIDTDLLEQIRQEQYTDWTFNV